MAKTQHITRLFCGLHLLLCASLSAQSADPSTDSLRKIAADNSQQYTSEAVKKAPLENFSINGFYRFYAQHRMLPNPYMVDNAGGEAYYVDGRSLLVGDDTQLPELTLNISGRVNSKTSFGTDLVVWNQNNGQFDYYRNLLLGINLYGNFETDLGNVAVRMGGIHWHNMTAFTMRSFYGFNRFSLFERNPWDPQFKDIDRRYSEYYEKGEITQDARWANQAVQGFILDIAEMPWDLGLNVIYGKTQNAGSAFFDQGELNGNEPNQSFVQFYRNTAPNFVYGGRIIKNIDKHILSLNTFNRQSYIDELTTQPINEHVVSFDADLTFKKWSFAGEVAMAQYMDLPPGEMITLKVRTDKVLTKIPLQLHVFRISPNAMNNNSEVINTSITDVQSASAGDAPIIGSNGVLQQNGSAMVGISQMTNNRQGLNINGDFKLGKLKGALAVGVAKEIENINREITFGYSVNSLTMARFWRWGFPANVGPYGRKSVLFRSVIQSVILTDVGENGEVVNDKHFSNIELQLKHKMTLFGRSLHAFYLGAYNSAQTKFSPITVFDESAYIRHYSHQMELYYSLTDEFILTFYSGWERVIGNYDTRVDVESKRPLNQDNLGLGLGFDFMIAQNTGLYFRHRWFRFEDRSFALDNFRGHETTLELKIFF